MDNLLSAYAVCPKLEENIAQYFNSTAFQVHTRGFKYLDNTSCDGQRIIRNTVSVGTG
jgi:hypothetical protein